MRYFVCLLDPEHRRSLDDVRREYELLPRRRGLTSTWQRFPGAAVLVASDDGSTGNQLVATHGDHHGVGMVRLDNRAEVEQWVDAGGRGCTDLELVVRLVARYGQRYIPRLLGDFAFVVWKGHAQDAIAATDAFSVKKLYWSEREGLTTFASRAEPLARDGRYDAHYLAELVCFCARSPELSVYADVRPVPRGTIVTIQRGQLVQRRYWSPAEAQWDHPQVTSPAEAADVCRTLLTQAVRFRLGANGDTWAQLSGGLDSSSVVSLAQWLVERGEITHGLAGVVTYVDREGTASDEREYADLVTRRWHLRHHTIVAPPILYDTDSRLPQLDQPRLSLPLYPRDQRLCSIVRGAGGRVLVTGLGGDELFTGNMLFFADWLAEGRITSAISEMARWAARGRVSFWELAFRNALIPLLPDVARRHLVRDEGQLPPWIPASTARRYGLDQRTFLGATYAGRIGHKYQHALIMNVEALGTAGEYGVIADNLDVRHPFFYRPLVEFALSLPPELCARPQARKWVLREAMNGILPDAVRHRVGKGMPTEVLVSSLTTHRQLLEPLLHEPILADLGVIDGEKLRSAFYAMPTQPHRRDYLHGAVHATLMVEAWLQMRTGRWPRGGAGAGPDQQCKPERPLREGLP